MLFFLAGFQQVEFNVSGLSWLLIALYFARRRLLVVTWLGGDLLPGKRSGPVSLIEWSIVCWSRHQDLCRTSLTIVCCDRLCPTSNNVGASVPLSVPLSNDVSASVRRPTMSVPEETASWAWISPGIFWISPGIFWTSPGKSSVRRPTMSVPEETSPHPGRRPTSLRLSTRQRRNLSFAGSNEKLGLNRILYFAIKD